MMHGVIDLTTLEDLHRAYKVAVDACGVLCPADPPAIYAHIGPAHETVIYGIQIGNDLDGIRLWAEGSGHVFHLGESVMLNAPGRLVTAPPDSIAKRAAMKAVRS